MEMVNKVGFRVPPCYDKMWLRKRLGEKQSQCPGAESLTSPVPGVEISYLVRLLCSGFPLCKRLAILRKSSGKAENCSV